VSRLEIPSPSRSQLVIEGLYRDLERRIESSPPGLCPVSVTKAFLDLCRTQTCGKCVPCRIGLLQLTNLLTDVLNGSATEETLRLLEDTSVSIMHSADCAIGSEAAKVVYNSLIGCREDYERHIRDGRCTCTYSLPVPCVAMCPAAVDIPGYIALVAAGRYADAVRLIRKDNPFPTTCAFICEHPCEARCRRNMVDNPINIRGLKRVAVDKAGKVAPPPCGPDTGKRIAIVGGGPGGLSAAYFLRLMGHAVTVFEMNDKLGGMLRYGIPNYRLPKDRLDEDIEAILETGIEVKTGVRVGKYTTVQELRQEYDAVLITIGASTDRKIGLKNEDAKGVISAVEFLHDVANGRGLDLHGKKVAVIGGGNVAMDAVRTALRLGADKVSAVYRRRTADMTALPAEVEAAMAEGVEMLTLKAPASVEVNENGEACGLWVTPQMISKVRDGRPGVTASGEPDQLIECDLIVAAIGQAIEVEHFQDAGLSVSRGTLKATRYGDFPEMPGVFAGGDCVTGPSTVIKAIAAAKAIAANVDEYLGFHHQITADVEIPDPVFRDIVPTGRVELSEREACERVCDMDGVENCMSDAEACQEASRCLRCDHYGFGIIKGGRSKSW